MKYLLCCTQVLYSKLSNIKGKQKFLAITCDSSEWVEGLKLIFDSQGLADVMLHNTIIYFLTDKDNCSVPGVPDWAAWIAFLKIGTMSATLLTNHFF